MKGLKGAFFTLCLLPLLCPQSVRAEGLAIQRTQTAAEQYSRQQAEAAAQKPGPLPADVVTGTTEATEPTLQTDITRQIRKMPNERFLTFNSENDLYGGGTDRNYTNGARVTYFDLGTPVPDFFHAIDRAVPTFSINETTSISWSLGHNLYTPSDITVAGEQDDDRPWAAFLYGSAGLVSITKNHIDSLEATVGIVGPAAMGEQVQKLIHRHVSDSPMPKGWRHQLKNEPGIMLSWERSWRERYGLDALGWSAGATPYIGATLGNIYTYANTGVTFYLTPYNGRFQDTPVRVRPAMPGTGAFVVPDSTFSWYLFGGLEGRVVGRNIFLDGNTFTDSHSVDKKYLVGDATAGLALTYGRTRLSYALIYRTREFDEQDSGDVFGTVTLGVRF
ncbi:MAG: lipid A deacylase LpxR family protein [Alphaproteobacteria bacterium]|nr:lipid A deacylase LpxR family protein [Alphaproteobacteria bacterium]HRI77325.1 lipid A deacylase LpxR family protein [Alphaproteobacteria bacterium]